MADFYLGVKSTLDKIAVDLATSLGIGFVELDDTVNVEQRLTSTDDLVVYQLIGMDEAPTDPLWVINFAIGAKTTTDSANYDLASVLSAIKLVVKKGQSFVVKDYSGAAEDMDSFPPEEQGYFYITNTAVDPQMFEGASGIRMLNVQAAGVSYGN